MEIMNYVILLVCVIKKLYLRSNYNDGNMSYIAIHMNFDTKNCSVVTLVKTKNNVINLVMK